MVRTAPRGVVGGMRSVVRVSQEFSRNCPRRTVLRRKKRMVRPGCFVWMWGELTSYQCRQSCACGIVNTAVYVRVKAAWVLRCKSFSARRRHRSTLWSPSRRRHQSQSGNCHVLLAPITPKPRPLPRPLLLLMGVTVMMMTMKALVINARHRRRRRHRQLLVHGLRSRFVFCHMDGCLLVSMS